MRRTRIAALLLSGVMAASMLTGCGGVNKNAVVATFDEKEITLGVPNFAARLQQAYSDDMYKYYFGQSAWESDLSGSGVTMQDDVKNSVMDSMFEMYTLETHMQEYGVALTDEETTKISDTATAFLEANSKKALKELGADQETVEEYLRLVTIKAKMHEAMIADTDTNVSDEEANTSAYSYVRVSKTSYTDADGNTVDYTEDEKKELEGTVDEFAAKAQEGTLEDAADEYSYKVSTGTFTADDTSVDADVLSALKGLEEGELSGVIDTESAYYVVRLDAKTDADATEATRNRIISEREDARYDELITAWKAEHTWEVKDKVWKDVTFNPQFTTVEPTDEVNTTEQ